MARSALVRWAACALLLLVALGAFVTLSGAENPATGADPVVALGPSRKAEPLVLIFVDSLSDRVALDASLMPELNELRSRGASLTVEPCRDRLTYRCLHAALTGKDSSAPLSLRANFVRERGGHASEGTLLHLAAQHGRVVAAGAHDLESYDDAFDARWYFPGDDEAGLVAAVGSLGAADLTVVGMSQGDRAAHAHGPGSAAYRTAFASIDRRIGELVRAAPAGAHVVVFGDHGHDGAGHHLPGGEATTFAVYAGPAVRPGVSASMVLTDHRALLGVLLGLPTPALYEGPALDRLLDSGWLAARYGGVPAVAGHPRPTLSSSARGVLASVLGIALALALVLAARAWKLPVGRTAVAAIAGVVLLRLGAGAHYEDICERIHDHGDSPWRAAWLLVPLGLALVAARWVPGDRRRAAAALLPLVPLVLLFPSANYYGAGRAIVPAAGIGLAVLLAALARTRAQRPAAWGLWLPAAVALALYYDVRRVGGGASPGYYELKAAIVATHPQVVIAVSQVLAAVLLVVTRPASGDRVVAGGLLASGALLTSGLLDGLVLLPHGLPLGWVPVTMLLAVSMAVRGAPASALAAGWLALVPLYRAPSAAGLGVLIVAVIGALEAVRRARLDESTRRTAAALMLVIAGYLALWPMVGMRLAGVDFGFTFHWIPVERYEAWWWAIALATAAKLALPYALLGLAARQAGLQVGERVLTLGATKVLAVAVFAAAWGTAGPLTALVGQEALNELALTLGVTAMVAVAVGLGGLLAWRRARAQRGPGESALAISG